MEETLKIIYGLTANNIGGIVGICILLAFVGILNKIKKDLIAKFIDVAKSTSAHHHETTVQMSIACDRDINQELARLLFGANASRVGLFLFHNGSVFSTNSPIWKISATHERCESGVTQEFHKVQDVKASLLTPLILPMFTASNVEGVTSIIPERCPATGSTCGRKSPIFRIDPSSIKDTFTKSFLVNRGTKFAIMAPLTDWNDSVVGFVFLEYCHDGFLTDEELMSNTHSACNATQTIYSLISNLESTVIVDQTASSLKV